MKKIGKLILLLVLVNTLCFAQNPAIVREMLIFPGQAKHVHGSSFVSLPNGDFLALWFYGSGERTVHIRLSFKNFSSILIFDHAHQLYTVSS